MTPADRERLVALHASAKSVVLQLEGLIKDAEAAALAAKAKAATELEAAERQGGCKHESTQDVSTMAGRAELCLECGLELKK